MRQQINLQNFEEVRNHPRKAWEWRREPNLMGESGDNKILKTDLGNDDQTHTHQNQNLAKKIWYTS